MVCEGSASEGAGPFAVPRHMVWRSRISPAIPPRWRGSEKRIEAEARRILREKIKGTPWHAGCSPEERIRRIEADV
jgi:hypothetical protein